MGSFRSGNSRSGGFSRDNRSGGSRFGGSSRGFGGDKRSGDRFGRERRGFGEGDREMHDAECSKCGKQCKIPFRPSGGKPVYCSDCFKNNNSDSRGSFSPRGQESSAQNSNGISQEQFKQLNTKLDKIISILEQLEVDVVDEDEELDEIVDGSEDEEKDDKEDSKEKDDKEDSKVF